MNPYLVLALAFGAVFAVGLLTGLSMSRAASIPMPPPSDMQDYDGKRIENPRSGKGAA